MESALNRTRPDCRSQRALGILLACVVYACTLPARADSGRRMPHQVPAAYRAECAACHLAYPPGLLPARSWTRILSGLGTHYGTDAALDAATTKQLHDWLHTHAGTYKRVDQPPPDDRITRSAWFEHKHRRIDPQVWRHPSVKSAANCAACHPRADLGDFDDDHLRIPAGLDPRWRSAWRD